jgi:very-short-patch-repair endonuclease
MGLTKEEIALQRIQRVGERRIMQCGAEAEIIAYRNSDDIDIQFDIENQNIQVEHVRYAQFKNGQIAIPGQKNFYRREDVTEKQKIARIGEVRTMNSGLECRIIEYKSSKNITICFLVDGTVVKNRTYAAFMRGSIKKPKSRERVGLTKRMNNGQKCTVVKYVTCNDIDVVFEDGTMVSGTKFKSFNKGSIANPNYKKHLGVTMLMNNGMFAKVIDQNGCECLTIEFDDGTIVDNVRSCHFLRGKVANPNLQSSNATSLQEFAIFYYLRDFGFEKIVHGHGKHLGIGNYELDFYHHEKNIAIEYDGHVHDFDESVQRDIDKNSLCQSLGIKLYRLRSPRLTTVLDGHSIDYILNNSKEVRPGLIDCKEELESVLKENGIAFDESEIDFQRDEKQILKEFGEKYVNVRAKK